MIPENGGADKVRDELHVAAQRARRLEVTIVVLAGLAVTIASVFTAVLGTGNRRIVNQIKDCSEPTGECYQRNQKTTAAAIQTVLDYIDDSIDPHRLRNEAENTCQVELFAGFPAFAEKGVQPSLAFYSECVLRRSGNTAPPPVPMNPLATTTTTTTERKN